MVRSPHAYTGIKQRLYEGANIDPSLAICPAGREHLRTSCAASHPQMTRNPPSNLPPLAAPPTRR